MLYVNTGHAPRLALDPAPHPPAVEGVWLDLVSPTDAERALAERATGLLVPSEADLSEIESSSRLSVSDGVMTLSTPMTYLAPDGTSRVSPVGFVVSAERFMTIRFAEMPVFDLFATRFAATPRPPCSASAFLGLLEAIVDRLADVLEQVGGELERMSREVFREEGDQTYNASVMDKKLRGTLRGVGRAGERLSNIRDSLLGVNRILGYAGEVADAWIPVDLKPRFKTLRQDIASLSDYDVQLANKVQFLLDATLGFINIEQSNGIKILTVVSVVGVPPTLLASIYGMNFKWIPELQWEYGYFYGLTVIVLSGVLPFWWFKRKGWI
jgi:magnesium transporter